MVKHKKLWLSKIVGMSYNLERREYHILRHVRELISINLNWVSRKVYIGVSVFFFHLTLMISIHPTKGCNYWFSENRRPGQPILVLQIPRPVPFFLFLSGIANPKAHISYTGHAFIHIRVRREFSSRETAAFLRVVALCSSSFWTWQNFAAAWIDAVASFVLQVPAHHVAVHVDGTFAHAYPFPAFASCNFHWFSNWLLWTCFGCKKVFRRNAYEIDQC